MGYVPRSILFRQLAVTMPASSSSSSGPDLQGVHEELAIRVVQSFIGINLYKIRRVVMNPKVRTHSIAFDSSTNRED